MKRRTPEPSWIGIHARVAAQKLVGSLCEDRRVWFADGLPPEDKFRALEQKIAGALVKFHETTRADLLQRWKEVLEIIWLARHNMAVPGCWARFVWGAGQQLCCASHIAVAAGATVDALRSRGIREVLTPRGRDAIERLGGLPEIVFHNDDARHTLDDLLRWLDGHINSLTSDIEALQHKWA